MLDRASSERGVSQRAYELQHRQAFIGDMLKVGQAAGKGVEKGDSIASRLPFADGCIAMADTPEGLQKHNVTAMRFIRKWRLLARAKKCAATICDSVSGHDLCG